MNTINSTGIVTSSEGDLTVFSLKNITGKLVIDLLSEASQSGDPKSYHVDLMPVLVEGNENVYDVESFVLIIQEYIVHLQKNEHQDSPFRLIIQRKSKVDDSFYEKAGQGLKDYADKITIRSTNNMMILNCD